ncbi:hypothetical protein GHK68_09265 [Sinorhizobium meliloti]|uniref:hypothetical protein n=1 Tax=Rhizobium meliloti TaxID=382 RepID=UPI001296970A|nr:hypothetical protein [Sinorhizobium meliloti]MQW42523.1 hypothetical protein [Sinorhizobium meliloti]
MSPPPVEYRVFGNIAVHEKCRDSGDPEAIESDVAIIALGWESRFTAFGDHLRLKAKKIVVLDFALQDTGISAVDANREKLASLANGWGVEVLVVNLEPSTEYQKNINILDHALAQLAEPCGSYQGTLRRVFVECSTMPRIYIQWLVAFAFKRLAIQSLEFGYAEGVYTSTGGKDDFSSGLDRYVTVPHLQGGGGMGEEKVLLVGIGGDADVFYGLIDLVSPERISLLVPRSQKHAAIDTLLDQQVSKVRGTHRLEDHEVKDIDAFGLAAHLDAFESYLEGFGPRAVINVFVSGPKVQAIAAAVAACSDPRVQLKARIPTSYAHREVAADGRYHLYRLIDLTSPACSLPGTF